VCRERSGQPYPNVNIKGSAIDRRPEERIQSVLTYVKQRKRNRIPLGDVSCVIDVQMIPAVVSGQQLCGVARVVHRFVEIDHAIEFTAAADPSIDFLTDFFPSRECKSGRRKDRGRSRARTVESLCRWLGFLSCERVL